MSGSAKQSFQSGSRSNKVGTGDQFEAGARYASRISDELVQVFIRLVVTRDDTFKATTTYIDHSIANQ